MRRSCRLGIYRTVTMAIMALLHASRDVLLSRVAKSLHRGALGALAGALSARPCSSAGLVRWSIGLRRVDGVRWTERAVGVVGVRAEEVEFG